MELKNVTEESVKTTEFVELSNLHNLIHELQVRLGNISTVDMAGLKRKHDIIAAEFTSRSGNKHPTPFGKERNEGK